MTNVLLIVLSVFIVVDLIDRLLQRYKANKSNEGGNNE